MKKTNSLKVIVDIRMPFNRIVVNPNDGYDLDVLTKEILVNIHACVSLEALADGDGFLTEGSMVQENSCELGTMVMNLKTHAQIGKPTTVTLIREDDKLLIVES